MKPFPGFSAISSAAILVVVAVLFSGCKSATTAPETSNASSSAPGSSGTPGTTVLGSSASAKPQPVQVTLTVPQGVDIHARINESISAKTSDVGDAFHGTLTEPLTTHAGEVVYEKGTEVSGTVVSAKGRGRFAGAGVLAIELDQIAGQQVSATEYVVSKKGKGKRTAALIGGGAGGGALIGALAGGGKGALIGGLIGGGAGTAGAGLTGNKQLVIPAESPVVFELSQPLSKTIER
jgi:hypothetical protein